MIEVVCLCLILMNITQFVYWGYEIQKLVDKLMSRNYAEYVQIERFKNQRPEIKKDLPIAEEIQDEHVELNRVFS